MNRCYCEVLVTANERVGKVLIVTVYFLKNLETSTQKTYPATKYIKRTFFKIEKSLCRNMLLSTREKPAHAEVGKQSAFYLICLF